MVNLDQVAAEAKFPHPAFHFRFQTLTSTICLNINRYAQEVS